MPDPHNPPLSSLSFAEEEEAAIQRALSSKSPWDLKGATEKDRALLSSVKGKLGDFHMKRQKGKCCYCRIDFEKYGPFMRDREHILPKEKFKSLTYTAFNISVACKRCNMEIKGRRVDFVADLETIKVDPENPDRYFIVHPNFEKWTDHLCLYKAQENEVSVSFYSHLETEKGIFTYDFFRLKELTTAQFDERQGGRERASVFKGKVKELAAEFGQDA